MDKATAHPILRSRMFTGCFVWIAMLAAALGAARAPSRAAVTRLVCRAWYCTLCLSFAMMVSLLCKIQERHCAYAWHGVPRLRLRLATAPLAGKHSMHKQRYTRLCVPYPANTRDGTSSAQDLAAATRAWDGPCALHKSAPSSICSGAPNL